MTEEEREQIAKVRGDLAECPVAPSYAMRPVEEIMLPMADGVRLRTIISRPERAGRLPVIVIRTCYPQNDPTYRTLAEEYGRRGYGFIYQYCRGSGGSEGVWEPNVNERADGKHTLDWINDLDWVESIGYFGCSYLALTGWIIADIVPDKVRTMYLTHYGTFRHVSAYKDGLFRHDILTAWSMENAGFPVDADYLETCRYRPQVGVDEALWGRRVDWYRDWITRTDADDPYWNEGVWGILKEIPGRIRIPIYVGEGWYDHHLGSCLETYKALSPECKAQSRFLIGAWRHGFDSALDDREAPHLDNNDNLRAFLWFDEILQKGHDPEGSIDYYLIGADRWISRKEFEIANQPEMRFYLTRDVDGALGLSRENGRQSEFCYTYNPEHPQMTHGAESMLRTNEEQGSLRQPAPGETDDVVTLLSEPLPEDIPVVGQIKAVLHVSSDAEDTSYVFRIMEVMADGRTYNMRNGITTLGYRNGAPHRIGYEPGEMVEITIDTWDLAWQLHKGSRIRVDITSSDFPEYAVHSNYAGVWSLQEHTRVAHQTIYMGESQASYISLPILP